MFGGVLKLLLTSVCEKTKFSKNASKYKAILSLLKGFTECYILGCLFLFKIF